MKALTYLSNVLKMGHKEDLRGITYLLERLGNPHLKYRVVHVGGTDGKGSTVAFISFMLQEAGFVTGRLTSPHLHHISERITVNDEPISETAMDEIVAALQPLDEEMKTVAGLKGATFFEVLTAMGFQHFAQTGTEFAVVEVGMGGRLDSTNVVQPEIVVITSIGLDHTEYLGNTLAQIASEKAAIIKPGSVVVSGATEPEAFRVIESVGAERKAEILRLGRDFSISATPLEFPCQRLDFHGPYGNYKGLTIPLAGNHQAENCALALAAIQTLKRQGHDIPDEAIEKGLAKTRWPCRLEMVSESPLILLDGAHNPSKARRLMETVKVLFPDRNIILVIGVLASKDVDGMMSVMAKASDRVIATQPSAIFRPMDHPTPAAAVNLLAEYARKYNRFVSTEDTISSALESAKDMCGQNDLILVTGSLFTVAEARELFIPQGKQDGR